MVCVDYTLYQNTSLNCNNSRFCFRQWRPCDVQNRSSRRNHLDQIGINLFNFSFNHSINEIRNLAGDNVTLVGNVPPRDIMANGKDQDVRDTVREILNSLQDKRRLILSCGGGMIQDTSTENIQTFLETALENS